MTVFTEEQIPEVMAAVMFAQLKMLTDREIPLLKAFRLVVIENLQGVYGDAVWSELGVPQRSIERYRAELREKLALMPPIEDVPPASVEEAFARLEAAREARKAL